MTIFQNWQRLWERASVRCERAMSDFNFAVADDFPTDELLKVWASYDRWYKVREYIARRMRDCAISREG